jgi:hypothetical protein
MGLRAGLVPPQGGQGAVVPVRRTAVKAQIFLLLGLFASFCNQKNKHSGLSRRTDVDAPKVCAKFFDNKKPLAGHQSKLYNGR